MGGKTARVFSALFLWIYDIVFVVLLSTRIYAYDRNYNYLCQKCTDGVVSGYFFNQYLYYRLTICKHDQLHNFDKPKRLDNHLLTTAWLRLWALQHWVSYWFGNWYFISSYIMWLLWGSYRSTFFWNHCLWEGYWSTFHLITSCSCAVGRKKISPNQ